MVEGTFLTFALMRFFESKDPSVNRLKGRLPPPRDKLGEDRPLRRGFDKLSLSGTFGDFKQTTAQPEPVEGRAPILAKSPTPR